MTKFSYPRGKTLKIQSCFFLTTVSFINSEDGTICLYDSRSSTQPVGTISRQIEVSDVRYHPLTGTLFISTDEVGRVLLHDARMAFENDRPGDGKMGTVLTVSAICMRS